MSPDLDDMNTAVACFVLTMVLGAPSVASDEPFRGEVLDSGGQVLDRVGVFLFEEPGGTVPVALRLTDDSGRFLLDGIRPGPYRIAAVRDGYRLYLGRVDTLLQRTVRVILHPKPREGEPGSESLPTSSAWALRLPRRSLLRETDAPVLTPRAPSVEAGAPDRGLGQVLSGDFSHAFEARSLPGAADHRVDAYGLHTALRMTGLVSEGTRLTLEGSRRSLEPAGSGGGSDGRIDLAAAVRFDPGVHDRIDARAYRESGSPGPGPAGAPWMQWGYAARWDRVLDGSARIAMTLDYRRAALSPVAGPVPDRELAVGAEYEVLAAHGHRVRTIADARGGAGDRVFSVRSEDAWTLSAPLTLVYGLGYRHREGFQASETVRPAVAAVWSAGPMILRLGADYAWSMPAGAGKTGTTAGLELALPAGFRLQGRTLRDPAADGPGHAGQVLGTLLVRSYGEVRLAGRSATLSRDGGWGRVGLTWRDGSLQGFLGAADDPELPVTAWAAGDLDFEELELEVRLPGSGTDLAVAVRGNRVVSQAAHSRLVAVHLLQDLYRPARGPAWRLVVNLQAEHRRAVEAAGRYAAVHTGVSVNF